MTVIGASRRAELTGKRIVYRMGFYVRTPRIRGRIGPMRASVGLTGASVSLCCVGCSPCLTICVIAITLAAFLVSRDAKRVTAGPTLAPVKHHDDHAAAGRCYCRCRRCRIKTFGSSICICLDCPCDDAGDVVAIAPAPVLAPAAAYVLVS